MCHGTLLMTAFFIFSLLNMSVIRAEGEAESAVKIKSIPVSKNIYMLTGKGGNIGVFLGEDGTFMVDDQFAPLSDKILAAVKSLGGEMPRFLVNTHFHGDHTGGNENLGKKGALIISHNNVRTRLANGSTIAAFSMKTAAQAEPALPLVTFSEMMSLHINEDLVELIHVPHAHTDGDSYIHFEKANVVHAGDIYFNGFYPFIDAAHGGSLQGVIHAANSILAITDKNSKIIPGHGPLSNKQQLVKYRDMLQVTYQRLLKLKNEGVSVVEAISRKPLADLENQWGGGMFTGDQWIEVIYPAIY
ncbi:MAG: MBL fold metallo-hydrolase [Gammaproteobacteria bacterium]